ncbi:tripartite tricarboxylate transporter substrate binding protein [Caldimonas thermodepolymerans]|jgi:tripartite-type tricarboxylate transporter receptor subunit TctC|uniref:ABC transporter substrate-binding protein n=1 Tax=Caldimonas thermodepolymerans TaxID=215580 RepID=A0A2S5T9R4_9BURK|nr:tripartite tricarboxylate transporter substrate binding protein [Caldimonas thermodepolymerans]PPE71672.1 ABC transporter substrate-binding protein [Caldimonas thermodepolymerans]QPC30698.1 tripartite tricarboxylate transporter substrate binding protein [Caldimonas thermodepolymerans]RDI02688.1 tripartite-type tricarboxylate transporter receptor subunit TctC [Caldimonas thermodepolymerans]TCP08782.1 tripartite-type tricarboxylate transporter receptor subunit TctC [Caldimonas thermodepolymera
MLTRRDAVRALALAVAATAAIGASPVRADTWPSKPITIIVPFPAGGGTDAFARPLAAVLTKQLGMQVLIDNKGGAGGTLGASVAARAPADGYTFFMGAVHHAIAPAMYPKLDYDILNDFTPVGLVSNVPQVIVVNPKLPINTVQELLAEVRAKPGKLNYGSAGNGTSHHLAGELFKIQTGTFITHIPYRGAGPALQDLIAGQVEMMFDGLGSSAGHIKAGRIRPLAVAAPKRAPGFPDIPTSAEAGIPDYKVSTWYGLWVPKGTPKEAIDRMTAELRKAFASEEIRRTWTSLGSEIPETYGPAFGTFVAEEVKRWAEVAKASGAKLD